MHIFPWNQTTPDSFPIKEFGNQVCIKSYLAFLTHPCLFYYYSKAHSTMYLKHFCAYVVCARFFHAFLYLPLYSHILLLPDPDALVHICPKLATYDRGNFLLESLRYLNFSLGIQTKACIIYNIDHFCSTYYETKNYIIIYCTSKIRFSYLSASIWLRIIVLNIMW